MCRLLFVESNEPFQAARHLIPFSEVARNSKEYQGHGWGCAYWADGRWAVYRDVRPVWEDDLRRFPKTVRLLAHARSAFRNEGVAVENNMPFTDGKTVFAFNGELHGVRIKSQGRTGAEKVFTLIRQLDHGDTLSALKRAVDILQKRARHIKAMNIILSDGAHTWASSLFSEDPDYFTLRRKSENGVRIVCSEPYPGESGWLSIDNRFAGVV